MQKFRRSVIRIAAACAVIVTICTAAACFFYLASFLAAMKKADGPSPDTISGRRELQSIVDSTTLLTNALTRYRQVNGKFPTSLTALSPTYFKGRMSDRWYYGIDGKNGYILCYKLSWDAQLRGEFYSSKSLQWKYDPGNGNPSVTIDKSTTL